MIKIGHFRSKLDVLFHVLISSFWLQTKISWFSARKFRGLFFEHLELNFRPSIFFHFRPTQKIYEISKLDQQQSDDSIGDHFTCVKLHIKLLYLIWLNQIRSAATAWNWLQLLAIGCSCLQMVATGCNCLELVVTACKSLQLQCK